MHTSDPSVRSPFYSAVDIGLPCSDQNVIILDDKQLVLQRHAMPPLLGGNWDGNAFLAAVVAAFPDVPKQA